ncbi:unnamed protein product [Bursaphelenchus xylophilus]|uniref:(pine wood nematode) hypothetical protein n=1 Tax=Bursaphelenchus xylophilus TaxID=6326 RepID=A0A1I7SRX3_BURXY|nr:unnamed protein product [Bursaphelenchus xylophilus]CAG9101750.1 unnamed protein product [Bursaphelenchus xylophilus]
MAYGRAPAQIGAFANEQFGTVDPCEAPHFSSGSPNWQESVASNLINKVPQGPGWSLVLTRDFRELAPLMGQLEIDRPDLTVFTVTKPSEWTEAVGLRAPKLAVLATLETAVPLIFEPPATPAVAIHINGALGSPWLTTEPVPWLKYKANQS